MKEIGYLYNSAVSIDVNEIIEKLPFEQGKICKLLIKHDFNINKVCSIIGKSRITVYDKIKKLRQNTDFINLKIYLPN